MAAPCEDATLQPTHTHVFNQLRDDLKQCELTLAGLKSPAEKYKDQTDQIKAKRSAAWTVIFNMTDMTVRQQTQEEIEGYSGQLKRLEINYNDTVVEAEAEHQRQINSILDASFKKLGKSIFAILGPQYFDSLRQPDPPDAPPQEPSQHPEEPPEERAETTPAQQTVSP